MKAEDTGKFHYFWSEPSAEFGKVTHTFKKLSFSAATGTFALEPN